MSLRRAVFDAAAAALAAGVQPTSRSIAAELGAPINVVSAHVYNMRNDGLLVTRTTGAGSKRSQVVLAIARQPAQPAARMPDALKPCKTRWAAEGMAAAVSILRTAGPQRPADLTRLMAQTGITRHKIWLGIRALNASGLLAEPARVGLPAPSFLYRLRTTDRPAYLTAWRGPTRRTPGARTRGLIPDGVITGTVPPPPPEPAREPVVPAETLTRTPSHTAPGMAEDCVKQRLMAPVRSFDPGPIDASWLADMLARA